MPTGHSSETGQIFTSSVVIRLERRMPVSPGRLWHALTDSSEVSAWMKFPATIGPGLGGRIMVEFGANEALDGIVCGFVPDKSFAYTWGDSIVRFDIISHGTAEPDLALSHSGVSLELASGLAAGWHGFLDQLQSHLTGVPRTSKDADLLRHYRQVYSGFAAISRH